MDVGFDPIGDLMGCFMAVPNSSGTRNTGFVIEVRTNLEGYELVARGGLYPQKFKLHRASRHELDLVDEATRMHMRAGLSVKWNADMEPAPVGVYKGKDENGRPIYLAYFRNTYGPALKMACPSAPGDSARALRLSAQAAPVRHWHTRHFARAGVPRCSAVFFSRR